MPRDGAGVVRDHRDAVEIIPSGACDLGREHVHVVADDDPLLLAIRQHLSCLSIHGFQGKRYDNFIDHVFPQIRFQLLEIGDGFEPVGLDRFNAFPIFIHETEQDVAEPRLGADRFGDLNGPVIGPGDEQVALISAVEPNFLQNESENKAAGYQRRAGGGQEHRDEKRVDHCNVEQV